MDELTTIKKSLKKWEGAFYFAHRRKPCKDDIENAPDDIKANYKRYAELRKNTQSQTKTIEVWGEELNKSQQKKDVATSQPAEGGRKHVSAMQKLSQKLRANITSGKQQPSKDGFLPKGTLDVSRKENGHVEKADPESINGEKKPNKIFENALKFSQNKSWSPSPAKHAKINDKVDIFSPNKISSQKKLVLNSDFLQRHGSRIDVHQEVMENIKNDMDEENGLVKKDTPDPDNVSVSKKNWQNKKRYNQYERPQVEADTGHDAENAWLELKQTQLQKEEDKLKNSQGRLGQSNWNPLKNLESPVTKMAVPSGLEEFEDLPPFEEWKDSDFTDGPEEFSEKVTNDSKNDHNMKCKSFKLDSFIANQKLANPCKTNRDRTVQSESGEGDECDAEVSTHLLGGKRLDASRQRLKRKRQESEPEPTEVSDVTWRSDSRCGQYPEDINVPSDDDQGKNKESGDEEASKKVKRRKTSTTAVKKVIPQENFVRLNMKVKRFSRGGNKMKGGAFKRMAWKKKMSARSADYGDKCFKCGETGHWASKCPGNKKLPSGWADDEKRRVDDAEFPSLKEAMQMARGIKKKPKTSTGSTPAKKVSDEKKLPNSVAAAELAEGGEDERMVAEDDDDVDLDVVRSAYEAPQAPESMHPIYQPSEIGDGTSAPPEVYDALGVFGYSSFREGQEQAVMRVLSGQSTLVVLSTGAGKSLCYQLPAYIYAQRKRCTALVISPLVSLMDDQVTGLPAGIIGKCLHNSMPKAQREKVLASLKEGIVHFLLVSPEALVGGGQSGLLPHNLPPISFACIDEAHCVSEWSHHFRPSYLRICKVLRERFGVSCMLGLTATATLTTAASVSQHLGIQDYRKATIRGTPVPNNLLLSVSRDEDRDQSLISLLQGERFSGCNSIIIYCTRRDQTTRLATLIRTCLKDMKPPEPTEEEQQKEEEATKKGKGKKKVSGASLFNSLRPSDVQVSTNHQVKEIRLKGISFSEPVPNGIMVLAQIKHRFERSGCGHIALDVTSPGKPKKKRGYWDAEAYHAGLSACQRRRVQNQFMGGYLRVVVATVAFGMGLDKSDVRGIIHYNLPKSFESYVQEIGRAGRDGKPAHCHVFLDEQGRDVSELKRHIFSNTIDRHIIKKLVQKVFPPCRCRDTQERHLKAMQDCGKESAAVHVASEHSNCRICPGHERAIPIDDTVQALDIREEGLSTLLCYLELHEQRWVENMTHVYSTCRLSCYGGPQQLQEVALKCPPVAVAIAHEKKQGVKHGNCKGLEFNVVEVSDSMGWESGPVKKELKMLQWNFQTAEGFGPRKSGVLVEFSNLGFHLRSPGDLLDEEVDDVVNFLNGRVSTQEKTDLSQLRRFYKTLASVAHRDVWMCHDQVDTVRSDRLKTKLREYFEHQPLLQDGCVTQLSFTREAEGEEQRLPIEGQGPPAESAIGDIRAFIHLYSEEHTLSGRAIARIFHGIPSPCFPPEVWGRVRRFWRAHLDIDFNELRNVATQQLIQFR